MPVTAHDDEIDARIGGVRKQCVSDIDVAPCNAIDFYIESVTR